MGRIGKEQALKPRKENRRDAMLYTLLVIIFILLLVGILFGGIR